jgi:DNA adenine methylase
MRTDTYNGGKGAAGVAQTIINQQPPHTRYAEPFLGFGRVLRAKREAAITVGTDVDGRVISTWLEKGWAPERATIYKADAFAWLEACDWGPDGLVYLDPPYLHATRAKTRLYAHELTDQDHRRLLDVARGLRCMVQLSGYRSDLYDDTLVNWRRVDFQAMTRRGMRTESLWMNYPAPDLLHCAACAGLDYRERERIRKKAARWAARWATLPPAERQAVAEAIARTSTARLQLPMPAGTAPLALAVQPGADTTGAGGARSGTAGHGDTRCHHQPPGPTMGAGTHRHKAQGEP